MALQKRRNLDQWFFKKSHTPMVLATVLVLMICGVQIYKSLEEEKIYKSQGLKQVSEMISLGLAQKNRVLVESLLDATRWQFGSSSAYLCNRNNILMTLGEWKINCTQIKGAIFSKKISVSIPGFAEYEMVLLSPVFSHGFLWFGTFFISLALLLVYLVFILKVEKSFKKDILTPLKEGLVLDQPMEIEELERLRLLQKEVTETKVKAAVADAVIKRNQQIAHDIKSPLAALGVLTHSFQNLKEDERLIFNSAVNRIRDISNTLAAAPSRSTNPKNTQTQLIAAVLDPILSEKRIEYQSRLGLEIDFNMDQAYGLCAKINGLEFKRVISNLINNAVEASAHQTRIFVQVKPYQKNRIEISIQDRGKGISPEILACLGKRGETYGKKGGSGLGLYHAKMTLESWGGELVIESKLNFGTCAKIHLLQESVPLWFMPELILPLQGKVVVLDDDPSIHHIWNDRFEKMDKNKLELVHLSTPSQVQEIPKDSISFFLMDYELLGYKENGLDLIEQFSLQDKSCLVTSRFEEESLLKRCQSLGVRLIPKSLAGSVPIHFVIQEVAI